MCGSALHGIGVQPLFDGVAAYLPNPTEVPPVEGIDPSGNTDHHRKSHAKHDDDEPSKSIRKPDPDEPFCGLVFKVLPYKTGDLSWVRIYSGTLKGNSRVLNATRDKKENVAQLWRIHASKKTNSSNRPRPATSWASSACATPSRATRCATPAPRSCSSRSSFPRRSFRWRSSPRARPTKRSSPMSSVMLRKQDPTFAASENEETGQTLISGMGELHLEVIQHRLQRDFNLNVKVHNPRVSYRETVATKAEASGECNRLINGMQHVAEVRVQVEPFESTSRRQCGHQLARSRLPSELLTVVLEELENAAQGGGLLGFPLMRLKATLLGGTVHETSSTEIAFRTAANLAFDAALRAGGEVLLEPIMKLEVSTPDDHVGDLIGDLQQRRAIISDQEARSGRTVIHAEAPLAELFGYSSAMRSLSQGRASCSMQPSTYSPAPDEVLKKFL